MSLVLCQELGIWRWSLDIQGLPNLWKRGHTNTYSFFRLFILVLFFRHQLYARYCARQWDTGGRDPNSSDSCLCENTVHKPTIYGYIICHMSISNIKQRKQAMATEGSGQKQNFRQSDSRSSLAGWWECSKGGSQEDIFGDTQGGASRAEGLGSQQPCSGVGKGGSAWGGGEMERARRGQNSRA